MKTYKLLVSFGNGIIKEATVSAKSGALAQDEGFRVFPGSRTVRVVGVIAEDIDNRPKKQKPHPLFYP
jgi:hypothetical protein